MGGMIALQYASLFPEATARLAVTVRRAESEYESDIIDSDHISR
jgi:hypothetical protein